MLDTRYWLLDAGCIATAFHFLSYLVSKPGI